MNELLNHVYELIRLKKGDLGRLEHIKNTLENKRTMYVSDKQYVEGLVSRYLLTTNKIQSNQENSAEIHENESDISETIFCWKCGNSLQSNQNFCSKCGASKIQKSEQITDYVKSEKKYSGIRSYQILSIIGGVLGILVTLLYSFTAMFVDVIGSSFGSGFDESFKQYFSMAATLVIIVYISCFIIPFVIKKTKAVGIYLIISSFIVLIATSFVGITGFALLLPAGILALRSK